VFPGHPALQPPPGRCGDGMIEEDLFSFYLRTKKDLSDTNDRFYERLKEAPLNTKTQLRILCGDDEECMSEVIRLLLRLLPNDEIPSFASMLDGFQKKVRRTKAKGEFQQRKRERERRKKLIEKIEREFKDFDTKSLRELADKMNSYDPDGDHEPVSLLSELITKASKPGKTNVMFNGVICRIYEISRKATDNSNNFTFTYIAKLLTSFKIKKTKGNNYTVNDIYGVIHRNCPRKTLTASKSL
jgi:hypothetical protein